MKQLIAVALYGSAISLACIWAHNGHPIKGLIAALFVTFVRVQWPGEAEKKGGG